MFSLNGKKFPARDGVVEYKDLVNKINVFVNPKTGKINYVVLLCDLQEFLDCY
jgi:hypothetical protein